MFRPTTILLLTREQGDYGRFSAALRKSGRPVRVHWAHGGSDGCAYLAGDGGYADRLFFPLPELVLADLAGLRAADLEFLRWLRKDFGYRDLPVVLLDPSIDPAGIERGRAAGANLIHAKPVDDERFEALMAEIVRRYLACPAPSVESAEESGRPEHSSRAA